MNFVDIDFHVHTNFSSDCNVSPQDVVRIAKQRGLNGVAITDHNNIDGALRMKAKFTSEDFVVIVGEEIRTREGEIVGLFLGEEIPPGLPVEESVRQIQSQEGMVCVGHPFCRFRRSRLELGALMEIIEKVDAVEVYNSRTIFNADNRKAWRFAKTHGKLMIVGSDGHTPLEYGRSHTRMLPFNNVEECKRNLLSAEFVTEKSPLWVHCVTKWRKLRKPPSQRGWTQNNRYE